MILTFILIKNIGGLSLFSDMWEQTDYFQSIWAVDIANHRFHFNFWFNWKLSAGSLEVWKRDSVFPLLVTEFVTPLHIESLLRLPPASGQLADKGGLSKTDCPAQHCSGWISAEATHATLATVGCRGKTVQFWPHLFFPYSWLLLESWS